MADVPDDLLGEALERALRRAAVIHRDQARRGSGVPYVQHVAAVAMILDRLGFPEPVVIAGLLHDAVEDTDESIGAIEADFGPEVAALVRHNSELKVDETGRKRPWEDRKRDHLEALADAPVEARAVALADKLHNLLSIRLDLAEGRDVWSSFRADRGRVLWYYRAMADRLGRGDPRLEALADRCRALVNAFEADPE